MCGTCVHVMRSLRILPLCSGFVSAADQMPTAPLDASRSSGESTSTRRRMESSWNQRRDSPMPEAPIISGDAAGDSVDPVANRE